MLRKYCCVLSAKIVTIAIKSFTGDSDTFINHRKYTLMLNKCKVANSTRKSIHFSKNILAKIPYQLVMQRIELFTLFKKRKKDTYLRENNLNKIGIVKIEA